METQGKLSIATLGGGCFWCIEGVFQLVRGVKTLVSGFSGGHIDNPTYGEVCKENTGHAEVVQITFDPKEISYGEILEIFFAVHDPTQLNRQGNDVGTQYRSVIFYHTQQQKETAEQAIERLNKSGKLKKPVVTEITRFEEFYPASDYHQNYYRDNSSQPYCRFVIAPKIAHFLDKYPDKKAK